ncbi:MAG TPA: AAA domain-containing protein [Candidatus Sulfotelmatobacter sp.]|nr:AAA domain-containing protein [Candidatus Sulfotelmatobacter sp.]
MKLPTLIADRYLLSPHLKEGRISEVFKASDAKNPGRIVAVKVFKFGLYEDAVIQEAFEREGQILTDLQHPSIIPLLDFAVEPQTKRPFLVLDWGGTDLKASIDKSNIRDWDTFYDLFGKGILEALAFAHSRGVVHRDLKPTDLLRSEDGRIRLADFGIAKYRSFLDHNLDLAQFVTEPFTPEGGHDPNYSAAADVFGFGAIVLDFLSNVALKKWSDLRLALSQVQAPREIIEKLESSISPDPSVRPADAQILLAEIERIQSRRHRQAVNRRPCFISVLPNALIGLKRNEYLSSDRDAQALVLREVNAGSTLRKFVRLNRETGIRETPQGEYSLFGNNMIFHVAIDRDSQSHLVLLSAWRPTSSADFDRSRDEAWVHPFEFKLGRHPVPSEGQKVMADLKLGCDQFDLERKNADAVKAEEDLFRAWGALLQARVDQAESNQAVAYTDRTIEGNRIVFRTKEPLDASAIEQIWEVPLGEDRSIRGMIDSVEGELATLYVEGGLPKTVPDSGTLRLDARSTKAAIKKQKDALDTVKFDKAARPELKQLLLHPEHCQSTETPPPDKWFLQEIDQDKKEAVKRALASKDFFVVHGPPGTGKTTFITELVLQFLARNPEKRILLTSQTHIGVDNAIERLGQIPQQLDIIRVGYQTGKVAESVHPYLLQNKIRIWAVEVQQKAEKFIEDWASTQSVNIRELRLGLRVGQLIAIVRQKERDEFDLVGLKDIRSNPNATFSEETTDESTDPEDESKGVVSDAMAKIEDVISGRRDLAVVMDDEDVLPSTFERAKNLGATVFPFKWPNGASGRAAGSSEAISAFRQFCKNAHRKQLSTPEFRASLAKMQELKSAPNTLPATKKEQDSASPSDQAPRGKAAAAPSIDAAAAEEVRARTEEIENQIELLQERLAKSRAEERRMREELRRLGDDGKAIASEKLPDLVSYQEALLGQSDVSQKFRRLLELNNEWRQRFGSGEDCYEAILASQHVIAGTCIGIGGISEANLGEFDLCILDEASKATPSEALVPLVRSRKWILVGDQKQLPPYVDATLQHRDICDKFDLDPAQLRETLLTRLQGTLLADHQAQLTTQHRMLAPIGNLISAVFYDNSLMSIRTHTCPVLSRVFQKPVAWFSTSKLRDRHERRAGASFLNPVEAQEILKILGRIDFYATALKKSSNSDKLPNKISVAILSGYAAQAEHIDKLLEQKRHEWNHIDVRCNTVDAFQGREADVAIFSVTRSNVDHRAGFLTVRERINVALSRGRNSLCIVGDADFVEQLPASPLSEVVDYIRVHSDECHSEEVTS